MFGGGGLNREGGLFNLAMMAVSALHKKLECKVEKLKSRSWRSYSRGSKTNPNFQYVNKPSPIGPNEVITVMIDLYSLSFISEE